MTWKIIISMLALLAAVNLSQARMMEETATTMATSRHIEMVCETESGDFQITIESESISTRLGSRLGFTRGATIIPVLPGRGSSRVLSFDVREVSQGTILRYMNRSQGFDLMISTEALLPTRTVNGSVKAKAFIPLRRGAQVTCQI